MKVADVSAQYKVDRSIITERDIDEVLDLFDAKLDRIIKKLYKKTKGDYTSQIEYKCFDADINPYSDWSIIDVRGIITRRDI
jgi:hypothetical protein